MKNKKYVIFLIKYLEDTLHLLDEEKINEINDGVNRMSRDELLELICNLKAYAAEL